MTIYKNMFLIAFVGFSLFAVSSCKTKDVIAQENRFQQELDNRAAEQSDALAKAGIDDEAAQALIDKLKQMDEDLMNFLASDPSNDAKSQYLKDMMGKRDATVRGSMSPEEYEAYRKALRAKTYQDSKEQGAPLIKPRG